MTRKQALTGITLLTLLSAGAGLVLWTHLPLMIPVHWSLDGRVNGSLPKTWAILLMSGLTLFPALFVVPLRFAKRQGDTPSSRATQSLILFMLSAMMTYTWGIMLAVGLGDHLDVGRAIVAGVFLFTMLMGNVSGRLRRTKTMGYVPSWMTDEIYLAYTRFAARVLFCVGAVGAAAVLMGVSIPLCMAGLTIAACLPLGYAYLLRRSQPRGKRLV